MASVAAIDRPGERDGQQSPGGRTGSSTVWMGLALVVGAMCLVYGPTFKWLYGRWTLSVWHNAHGLLIPPIVSYFVREELRARRDLPVESSAWGFAILVPALAMHALDTGMHTELLSAISLVVALPGLALLLVGPQRTRAILFPLSFAAFALPIPLSFSEHIHLYLRQIATATAAFVSPMLGVPIFAEGTTLHLADSSLLVGDGCSGFSTLYAALAIACLTAYSCQSTARRVLVLAAAAPLAILANCIRVEILVALVAWKGQWVLDTFLHPLSGMMTFALALPVIFWLGQDRKVAVAH